MLDKQHIVGYFSSIAARNNTTCTVLTNITCMNETVKFVLKI